MIRHHRSHPTSNYDWDTLRSSVTRRSDMDWIMTYSGPGKSFRDGISLL